VIRPKTAAPKGARKRTQSWGSHLSKSSPPPLKPEEAEQRLDPALKDEEVEEGQLQQQDDFEVDSELARQIKKQRLEGSYIEDLSHLTIASPEVTRDATSTGSIQLESPQIPFSPTDQISLGPISLSTPTLEDKNTASKVESSSAPGPTQPQLMEFNRNTEQMIEVYFKEGMGKLDIKSSEVIRL